MSSNQINLIQHSISNQTQTNPSNQISFKSHSNPTHPTLSFDSSSTQLSSLHHSNSNSNSNQTHHQKLNSIHSDQSSTHQTLQSIHLDQSSSQSSSSDHSTSTPSWPEASIQPDHQLTITLYSARELQLPPQRPHLIRPYAVLEFDQTESVTDDASNELSNQLNKKLPKWRGFKRTMEGDKTPIHTITNRRPNLSNTTSYDSSSRTPITSTSRSSRTISSSIEEPIWNHTATFDVLEPSASVYISIYDRVESNSDLIDDGFLGGTVINLEMGTMRSVDEDQIVLDEWIEIFDPKAEKPSGSVKVRIQLGLTPPKQRASKVELQHFDVIKLIGEGSYGQVFRVRKKDTKRVYAMKVLNKQKILKDGKQTLEHVLAERQILIKTRSSPFLVGLKFSFQSSDDLHLIMDLKSGGELMSYMQRYGGRFPEPWVVFYTAEILSGLSFLHSMDIIYRDLKPENCLLDATGHVALCDFGLSKMEMTSNSSTRTFCGTTEYIAPEILMENGYTRAVDFWALGVLIFEMTVGWTPFFSEDRVTKYSLILESDISAKIPKRGVEEMTRDIILQLLERDPKKRLGSETGSEEIKTHEFFKTIEWTKLINRRLRPPFRPRVESDADVMEKRVYGLSSMNFNPSRRSSVDNSIGLNSNEVFRNFTFSRQTSTSSLMRLENEEVNERLNRSIGRRSSSEDELDGYEDD